MQKAKADSAESHWAESVRTEAKSCVRAVVMRAGTESTADSRRDTASASNHAIEHAPTEAESRVSTNFMEAGLDSAAETPLDRFACNDRDFELLSLRELLRLFSFKMGIRTCAGLLRSREQERIHAD